MRRRGAARRAERAGLIVLEPESEVPCWVFSALLGPEGRATLYGQRGPRPIRAKAYRRPRSRRAIQEVPSRLPGTIRNNRCVSTSEPDRTAQWWTTTDVAGYLGVRVGTVSSYRQRGQMPAPDATFGRTHVWQPARIIEWHQGRPRPGVGGRPGAQPNSDEASTPSSPTLAYLLLEQAAAQVGVDASAAELIRMGSNAVFRLHADPVIARVALSSHRLAGASREVAVARWLANQGVPAVHALDVSQPVVIDGRAVTFWESASDKVEYGTTAELAALLRQLHALDTALDLPTHDPFARAAARLASLPKSEDVDLVASSLGELQPAYEGMEFELARGVIHGDANVGNVIRDRGGAPLLADLDSFAIGPREWDLVLTALYFERFGWHTEREYREFVDAYGFDIMQWSGYQVMADVRELLMVAWLAEKAVSEATAAEEFARRVETLRSGGSRRDWRAF